MEGEPEPTAGAALQCPHDGPPHFRLNFQINPGQFLNTEDRVGTSSRTISAVARACALLKDMEKHSKAGQLSLIYSSMKASIEVSLSLFFL